MKRTLKAALLASCLAGGFSLAQTIPSSPGSGISPANPISPEINGPPALNGTLNNPLGTPGLNPNYTPGNTLLNPNPLIPGAPLGTPNLQGGTVPGTSLVNPTPITPTLPAPNPSVTAPGVNDLTNPAGVNNPSGVATPGAVPFYTPAPEPGSNIPTIPAPTPGNPSPLLSPVPTAPVVPGMPIPPPGLP